MSALLGGVAVVIPNGFLAARLLRPSRDESAMAIMRSAWIGEIGKLLLTVLLFAAIFGAVRPLEPLAVFAASSPRRWWFSARCCSAAGRRTEAITKS